jgi:diacylglycerol O-acyltransferase / wax synthase
VPPVDPPADPPGVRRLRPDDHFMVLSDTPSTPMQIGALLSLEIPVGLDRAVHEVLWDHLRVRLAHTPLLAVLQQAPDGYDSDVWVDVPDCDHTFHVSWQAEPVDEQRLHSAAAAASMRQLDLTRPPFRVVIFESTGPGRCAMLLTVHHSVTDGVGFQTLLGRLSDEQPRATGHRPAGQPLPPDQWRAAAETRFALEESRRIATRARMDEARAALTSDSAPRRARTPRLARSGPTSTERVYTRLSLELDRVREVGRRAGVTVNDVFLALASSALRRHLIELNDLPDTPIVVNSARSYRRAEHGEFGNRIVALHPHLATHLADPIERLAAIRASMADERIRTPWDEAMLDQPERPYGPRDRRAKFAARTANGSSLLPGNVSLSNVPGPAGSRSYAGFVQQANHPVPILGNGRFLNITSRRNGSRLDLGLMADPTQLADVERIAGYVREALAEYETLLA